MIDTKALRQAIEMSDFVYSIDYSNGIDKTVSVVNQRVILKLLDVVDAAREYMISRHTPCKMTPGFYREKLQNAFAALDGDAP